MNKLIIGLPKGSLQESTYALFAKAGFNIKGNSRSYFPSIDDNEIELRLLRSQWVLAVPQDSDIQSVKDLEGKRIATEGVALVERWLEKNGVLRIVDTLMESYTQFFSSKEAWADDWKRAKLEKIALLLKAALNAADKVLLKLNVKNEKLEAVKKLLPALHAPTVSSLSDEGWYAVETVVVESVVREIIPELKAAGAEGIIEISLNKVVA